MNRKTTVKFRTEYLDKVGTLFQTFFAAGLLSVVFNQDFFGPLAWILSAYACVIGCLGSTWYRGEQHARLGQLATQENVANQFLKLVKQLNSNQSAIKGE